MISTINEDAAPGALCYSCRNELRAMKISTNHGNQALYVCENENCKRFGGLTTIFIPEAVTEPAKSIKARS